MKLHASEHDEQKALFLWAAIASKRDPRIGMMFAIPNGGLRNVVVAKKLKAEGVKAGVPDICLPVAAQGYHGLFIELKRQGGVMSAKQWGWIRELARYGYGACACYGWEDAKRMIEWYLGGNDGK